VNYSGSISMRKCSTKAVPVATPGVDPGAWAGWYVISPTRFRQFAYLDAVAGITRVEWDGHHLVLRPIQGATRELEPVGGTQFRLEGRRAPTHVLFHSATGVPVISDGQRTLERVSRWRVVPLWLSALAGVVALLALLVTSVVRAGIEWRQRRLGSEPLRWTAGALLLLLGAPLLYLSESFLAIGNPTPANVAVALATGLLPVALVASLAGRARHGLGNWAARLEAVALGAAIQWCLVLATWGLLPLMLCR